MTQECTHTNTDVNHAKDYIYCCDCNKVLNDFSGKPQEAKHTEGELELRFSDNGTPILFIYKDSRASDEEILVCNMPAEISQFHNSVNNAIRFKALWNACRDIPNQALKDGVVQEMMKTLDSALEQLDDNASELTDYYSQKRTQETIEEIEELLNKLKESGK